MPSGDLVRHVLLAQLLLEDLRLMVAAVEDRIVGVTGAMVEAMRHEAAHDAFRLGLVIGRGRHANRIAMATLAPQLLLEQFRIARDQGVRRAQDAHGGPVVLLELHHVERGKVLGQRRQIVDRRAAPAVDRLVIVADDGERGAFADQKPDEPVLRRIDVLVLVDEQIAAALPPLRRHGGVRSEEPDPQSNQIDEVDGLIGAQRIVIVAIGLGCRCVVVGVRPFPRGRGRQQRIFPGADPPLRSACAGTIGRRQQVGDDRLDVARIEDRKARLQAERRGIAPDDPEPQRMKRRDRDVGGEIALALGRQQPRRPFAHLACRLVGERDRGNTLRVVAARQEMRDLRGDHARLAAAGSRQHEQRAVEISHRLALRGIERIRHRAAEGAGTRRGGC